MAAREMWVFSPRRYVVTALSGASPGEWSEEKVSDLIDRVCATVNDALPEGATYHAAGCLIYPAEWDAEKARAAFSEATQHLDERFWDLVET